MAILNFLCQLAGATMLLLFAVRMVRTGIERSFGATFQRFLTTQQNLGKASLAGVVLAVVLQSSAAVALLTSGFAVSGVLSFALGLAIVLGGDFGSALVIQVLSFQLDWLVPVLLMLGGYLFVKVEARKARQLGRILMGIAFILISLRFLREAMDPIRDSAFLPAIAEYLARDYLTAFLVGGALAFVMHSSVAAILMCVTLVQIGAIPFEAGLSLVLGANFGSGFIPVWLSRGMPAAGRRIPIANLALRGGWATICLFVVQIILQADLLPTSSGGQMLVNAHLAFNGSLLLLALPLCRRLEPIFFRISSDTEGTKAEDSILRSIPILDAGNTGSAVQAIANLRRELLRMSDLVAAMFHAVPELYEVGKKESIRAVKAEDLEVNKCLASIRDFVSALPIDDFSKAQAEEARELMEYAIRLETAGDVVAKRLAVLADDMRRKKAQFSDEGWAELVKMHESIMANLKLASAVLLSDDLESARLLSLEKTEIKRVERASRKRHLRRLQTGTAGSLETSDIHLETLRSFREFNGHIAAVAYPVLYRNGQLLETRLIEEMPLTEKSA